MADYCTDVFKMVEDNEDSYRMWQGLVGPYYVPIMSNDGTLRWTNNGGLPNPSEVNLMGPQGAGIRIAGIRESAEELPATAPAGDIWLVGEGSPYEGYSFAGGEWLDLGPLTVGPAGPPGPQGDDYELTEADKQEIAEISEGLFLAELDNDPLPIRYGGTGAHDLSGAKETLGISDIEDKLGTWPLGTDAQDVAGAINEMIGEISLQVADIAQLKDNFAGEFSPTSTYAVGDYVVYGGAFWRCTTAVTTAGSWTGASNWEQVTAGGEFEELATLIASAQTALEALSTALSGKVSKAGDTMTGDLILQNASCITQDTSITSGTTPSSNIYGKAVYLNDSLRFNIGTWQIMALANGREGFQLVAAKKVNNVNKFNYVRMLVDANGDPVVELNGAAAWRSALSLNAINNTGPVGAGGLRIDFLNGSNQYYMAFYASGNNKVTLFDENWNSVWHIPWDYKANDTFSITSSLVLNGLIANTAKTTIYFDCVVDRSMENISTISVTAMTGYIVGTNGRDTSGTTDYTGSGFTLSCTKQGNHHVRIGITKTSAFPIGDAFTPAAYFGTLTLKFT